MLSSHYSRTLVSSGIVLLSLVALVGQAQRANAIQLTFDYSQDTNNFFGNEGSVQRLRLEEAADYFNGFTDQLSPRSSRSYDIPNPAGDGDVSVTTALGQDEIKIFAGGDPNLASLGEGGSLWFTSSVRGQTGAPTTDFQPVVGSLSFDSDATWHFGDKNSDPSGSQNDFLSVAIHEIGHVMGLGIAPSWDNKIVNGEFIGTNSVAAHGGNVPIVSGHWDFGIQSTVINSGTSNDGMMQETSLDPNLIVGTRKFMTELDYAGLEDIGWEVNTASVPFEFSPSLGILFVAGMFGTKRAWNTCKRKNNV